MYLLTYRWPDGEEGNDFQPIAVSEELDNLKAKAALDAERILCERDVELVWSEVDLTHISYIVVDGEDAFYEITEIEEV